MTVESCVESVPVRASRDARGARRDFRQPSPTNPFRPQYRPDIDGLRAVAVLAVVVYHAFPGWVEGGFVGVDMFFVISGFLISTILCHSLEQESFSFLDFYRRRIRRIFPALLVVLIVSYTSGWVVLLAEEYKQLGKHMAAGAGFVSNLVLWNESGYFETAAETKPLLHLWSLGIEEQFYILWPVLLWSAGKTKLPIVILTMTVAAVSFAWNLSEYRVDGVADFYSPQTRFWELLAGALLSYVLFHHLTLLARMTACMHAWVAKVIGVSALRPGSWRSLPNILSMCGACLVLFSLITVTSNTPFPGTWAVLPVLGCVCLIAAGSHAWLNRVVLSHPIVVWVGVISYPLYLWHWPLLSYARIIEGELPAVPTRMAVVAAAIVLAWLTYKFVEHPLRFNGWARTTAVALVGIMIVMGYTGYRTFQLDGLKNRSVVERNVDPDASVTYDANPPADCVIADVSEYVVCEKYLSDNPTGTVVMWGDSTAGMWLPVFLNVAKHQHLNVIRIEHKSCPPLLGVRKTRFDYPTSRFYCDRHTMEDILDFIKRVKPDSIVVLAAWNSFSPYTNREFITDGGEAEANAATTTRAIEQQVPMTLKALSEVSRVVVFKSWPFLPEPPAYGVNRLPFLKGNQHIVRASAVDFKKDSEFIESVFRKIDVPVEFFDPAARICDAESCSSVYKQVKLYKDYYHITVVGAIQFRSEIEALIAAKHS